MSENAPKKKFVRRFDWILIVASLALIAWLVFKQGGCQVIQKHEKSEWIENKS